MSQILYYDDHYDTLNIEYEKFKKLLLDAKDLSYEWSMDVLDCKKSWAREKINISFEDAMEKFDKNCFKFFVYRKGYVDSIGDGESWLLEMGFRTFTTGASYFMWIHCTDKNLPFFMAKYGIDKKD